MLIVGLVLKPLIKGNENIEPRAATARSYIRDPLFVLPPDVLMHLLVRSAKDYDGGEESNYRRSASVAGALNHKYTPKRLRMTSIENALITANKHDISLAHLDTLGVQIRSCVLISSH